MVIHVYDVFVISHFAVGRRNLQPRFIKYLYMFQSRRLDSKCTFPAFSEAWQVLDCYNQFTKVSRL